MNEKQSFSQKLESFIGGKGFYIVLFSCLAVIAVAAWLLFSVPGESTGEDYAPVMADLSDELRIPDVSAVLLPEETETGGDLEPSESVMNPVEVPVEPEEPAPAPAPAETQTQEETAEPVKEKPPAPKAEAPAEGAEEKKSPSGAALTFIWPVSGSILSPYSPDALVYSATMGDWRTHAGVDIESAMGVRVLAAATGTVKAVYEDDMLGTVVTIDHGDGLTSLYANLASQPTVKVGDGVTAGSVIGSVGDTALGEIGEAAHLHFALEKDGAPADPAKYLPRK